MPYSLIVLGIVLGSFLLIPLVAESCSKANSRIDPNPNQNIEEEAIRNEDGSWAVRCPRCKTMNQIVSDQGSTECWVWGCKTIVKIPD